MTEKLIYDIIINDDDETGIKFVSLVDDPAIEWKGFYFNRNKPNMAFRSFKDKQIIVGPALIPEKEIFRSDEDGEYYVVFSRETISKMVEKFNSMNNNKSINLMHTNQMSPGFIMENWIVEDETYDKSRVYGIEAPVGSWMIMVKIVDEKFWNKEIKEMGRYGFSIEGLLGTKLREKKYAMSSDVDFIDTLTDEELDYIFGEFKIPNRKKGEPKKDFISRCMGDSVMVSEYSDPKQRYAVCATNFAAEKISFDYDGTISTKKGTEMAKKYIDEGVDVYIISARSDNKDLLKKADELGIPHSRVFATGSNKAKVEKVNELNIDKHIDNNDTVVKDLGSTGQLFKLEATYNDYPQAATENAKIALRWVEKNGWGSCGTPVGKARAHQLANRESISRETIARMASFERHRKDSTRQLGDGCGRLMWLCWGGDEGIAWAQKKLKEIDNN